MVNIEVDFNLIVSDGNNTSFKTDGTYEKFDDFERLTFVELTDIKATTYVDIYADRIKLVRDGVIKMDMEYNLKCDTLVKLVTDFNYELSMNCTTLFLEKRYKEIKVIYQTESDKEQNITHNLLIKWTTKK